MVIVANLSFESWVGNDLDQPLFSTRLGLFAFPRKGSRRPYGRLTSF